MAELNGKHGEWKTINGAPVFIEDGQTAEEALSKLSDKPKHEKRYVINHGTYKTIVKESNRDRYKDSWEYKIYGDDMFEELDIDEHLDFIDNMDLSKPIKTLHNELRLQIASESTDVKQHLYAELNNKVAEYQESLAKSFLENVPKIKGQQILEESILSINKDRYDECISIKDTHSSEYAKYTYNCQRCAPAFILRWCHGYNVQAKPSNRVWNEQRNSFDITGPDVELEQYAAKNGYNRGSFGIGYGNYTGWNAVIFNFEDVLKSKRNGSEIADEIGYSGTEDQLRWIKNTVKKSGPGSAYLCSVCWKGTKKKDGSYSGHVFCIINDGGKVKFVDPQSGEECSYYFTDKQIVPRQTEIFRADNCRLNGTMMKEVVDYEENSK